MNWQALAQRLGSLLRETPQSVHRSRWGAGPVRFWGAIMPAILPNCALENARAYFYSDMVACKPLPLIQRLRRGHCLAWADRVAAQKVRLGLHV
jgi:hypothetical protein